MSDFRDGPGGAGSGGLSWPAVQPEEPAGALAKELVREVREGVEKLLELDHQAGIDGANDPEYELLEEAIVEFALVMRKADAVLVDFADTALEFEAHRRLGGRATARSYLRRMLDLTNPHAGQLLQYRDTLRPQPDPDPPEDADAEEIEQRSQLLAKRREVAGRLERSAKAGNFPVERSRQLSRFVGGFAGQKPGLLEEVVDDIADRVDSTKAAGFTSMMATAAEKHLGKRKSKEKSGVSQAYLTVHAPDINGMCRMTALLPAPTAALVNAAMHLNAQPGMFLELPDGVADPRSVGQRRVHALHHIMANILAGPEWEESEPGHGETGDADGSGVADPERVARSDDAPLNPKMRGPGDPEQGLLRWVRTDSPWWDAEKCPYVADLFTGRAQPLRKRLPGLASVVVAVRAGELDEELREKRGDGKRFPTNTGIALTLRELLSLGADKYAWLAELDDVTGRPLQLGRSNRIASLFQRMALLASETVCTYPGCEEPADECQTHHIDDWAHGGRTDIDNLTFRCPEHHRENDDSKSDPGCGHATSPRDTGRVGHAFPGKAPVFNDSPAARRSPGWTESWWATFQQERREKEEGREGRW
ncbi:HNH endonuclease signature motif containing protein [uncultured Corynebacterium sp.]|uniref:HNH endonuclease signature motif containing protein n=1 Tax=uncultured Corynebacterium sp. TaxID=159447 RepID=UPI0025D427D4|nr:HNH endonuclease signature motif containing protein [uncultured Corynebacterium sp.]